MDLLFKRSFKADKKIDAQFIELRESMQYSHKY